MLLNFSKFYARPRKPEIDPTALHEQRPGFGFWYTRAAMVRILLLTRYRNIL